MTRRRAVEFAFEVGILQAIVEGDPEIIIHNLINSKPSLALHGHLIYDAKNLASHFFYIRFFHVRR